MLLCVVGVGVAGVVVGGNGVDVVVGVAGVVCGVSGVSVVCRAHRGCGIRCVSCRWVGVVVGVCGVLLLLLLLLFLLLYL